MMLSLLEDDDDDLKPQQEVNDKYVTAKGDEDGESDEDVDELPTATPKTESKRQKKAVLFKLLWEE